VCIFLVHNQLNRNVLCYFMNLIYAKYKTKIYIHLRAKCRNILNANNRAPTLGKLDSIYILFNPWLYRRE